MMTNDPANFEKRFARPIRYCPPPGERVYAVGDIHGRADLLDEMLGLVAAHREAGAPCAATLVFLGDYIDRGPSSREVVERLIGIAASPQPAIFLLGNHEDEMLRFLAGEGEHWLTSAPRRCIPTASSPAISSVPAPKPSSARRFWPRCLSHRDFFLSLRRSAAIGGLFSAMPACARAWRSTRRTPTTSSGSGIRSSNSRQDFGKLVVHGHTPVEAPELRANRVNIDTGACFTGRLTCAAIEGGQVEFLRTGGRG